MVLCNYSQYSHCKINTSQVLIKELTMHYWNGQP